MHYQNCRISYSSQENTRRKVNGSRTRGFRPLGVGDPQRSFFALLSGVLMQMLRFSLRKLQDHFSTASPAKFIRISRLDKGTSANPPALLTYTRVTRGNCSRRRFRYRVYQLRIRVYRHHIRCFPVLRLKSWRFARSSGNSSGLENPVCHSNVAFHVSFT